MEEDTEEETFQRTAEAAGRAGKAAC